MPIILFYQWLTSHFCVINCFIVNDCVISIGFIDAWFLIYIGTCYFRMVVDNTIMDDIWKSINDHTTISIPVLWTCDWLGSQKRSPNRLILNRSHSITTGGNEFSSIVFHFCLSLVLHIQMESHNTPKYVLLKGKHIKAVVTGDSEATPYAIYETESRVLLLCFN